MYFTAFLIVVVLSAVVSLRRSMNISRNARGAAPAQRRAARWRAAWPTICAAIFALGLIAFDHVQDKQEFGPSVTIDLMRLLPLSSAAGFLASLAGWIGIEAPRSTQSEKSASDYVRPQATVTSASSC